MELEFDQDLGNGIRLKSLARDVFQAQFQEYKKIVFSGSLTLSVDEVLCEEELRKRECLREHMGTPLEFRFGLYVHDQFVGWHVADQKSAEEIYMRNSGILPDFHGQGLYSKMLQALIPLFQEQGFQVISSKHRATNNAVIIPKLKAGFFMTGFELSEKFGTMVRLEYFTNPARRSAMEFRTGAKRPSADLSKLLGL